MYIIAQTIGAILAAFLDPDDRERRPGLRLGGQRLAVNGFGELSPGKYGMTSALITRW